MGTVKRGYKEMKKYIRNAMLMMSLSNMMMHGNYEYYRSVVEEVWMESK